MVFVSWHDAVPSASGCRTRRASPTACRPRPSGSTPAGPARRRPTTPATRCREAFHKNVQRELVSRRPRRGDGEVVPLARRPDAAESPGACTTCTATSRSGATTGTGRTSTADQTDPVGRAGRRLPRHPRRQPLDHARVPALGQPLGTLPEDTSWLIGFRVVLGEMPADASRCRVPPPPLNQPNVRQADPADLGQGPRPGEAVLQRPAAVREDPAGLGRPALLRAQPRPGPRRVPQRRPAGDLVHLPDASRAASWASLASRLRYGDGRVGAGLAVLGRPRPQRPRAGPVGRRQGHDLPLQRPVGRRHLGQPGHDHADLDRQRGHLVEGPADQPRARRCATCRSSRSSAPAKGSILLPCDAVPGGQGGTAIHLSRDDGQTWTDPGEDGRSPTSPTARPGPGSPASTRLSSNLTTAV